MIALTTNDTTEYIRISLKEMRLAQNLSQSGLAERSGVSLGSLKKFEHTGQISLESLLKLCFSLGCLDSFSNIFDNLDKPMPLDEILAEDKTRKRGRRK